MISKNRSTKAVAELKKRGGRVVKVNLEKPAADALGDLTDDGTTATAAITDALLMAYRIRRALSTEAREAEQLRFREMLKKEFGMK